MDTRWKRNKRLLAVCFFLMGMTLLNGILVMAGAFVLEGRSGEKLEDAWQRKWQDTAAFQYYMEGYLQDFLGMATGGPVYYSWEKPMGWSRGISYSNVNGEWFGYALDGAGLATGVTVSEEENSIGVEETAALSAISEEAVAESVTEEARIPMTPEEYAAVAEAAHNSLKTDTNLLYRICYEGKELYTNAEGTGLDGETATLPEGYNFLLYFDGKKVHVMRDGSRLDLYGDGQYRFGEDWFVPGYDNFPVNEKYKEARVTIAVRKEPLPGAGRYGTDRYEESIYGKESRIYEIDRQARILRARCILCIFCLGVSLLCLLLAGLLRKAGREAAERIAACTRRVWYEVRLLLILAVFRWLLGAGYSVGNTLTGFGDDMYGIWAAQYAFEQMILPELLLFWGLWLWLNERRFRGEGERNCLLARIGRLLSAKEMQLPLQKRLLAGLGGVCGCFFGEMLLFCTVMIFWMSGIYYEDTVGLILWPVGGILAGIGCFFLLRHLKRLRQDAEDVGRLADQIRMVREGDMDTALYLPEDADLHTAAECLNEIRDGMKEAVEEQVRSERMKVELVANVSHDIKTPLTSIISYVELLKEEADELPPHARDYVEILDVKSRRLKAMVQDVFEVSKAASGDLPLHPEPLDYAMILRQTLADMQEEIASSGLQFRERIPEEEAFILADGRRMYRVFQNLIQNALKYSLTGSRVYVFLERREGVLTAGVTNTSATELTPDTDYTARFTRGDDSRTDGGSGLGLSIARSFTEACGGRFSIHIQADLFTACVEFDEMIMQA